ncbi:hypothetical protein Anapl_05442 [Anas platyrhynchos]|uniref:Uncharacterized protein n=1 Tax=Anas platyrhynchos TaxID=8839 RepID=R0LU75_ANAPL|nr:hypothetical protein Anapl_05442 [Anas platyrhynchos]
MTKHQLAPLETLAAGLLGPNSGWAHITPPPVKDLHQGIKSCRVFIMISFLSANCRALGDAESKATHARRDSKTFSSSLTAIVLLSVLMSLFRERYSNA